MVTMFIAYQNFFTSEPLFFAQYTTCFLAESQLSNTSPTLRPNNTQSSSLDTLSYSFCSLLTSSIPSSAEEYTSKGDAYAHYPFDISIL
ncbi:unnamed protein product [Rhizophagus irregularis]|nr:unnamed protein product [Rhizophagus irregularis]